MSCVTIVETPHCFTLRFRYDRRLVEDVKALPGRTYDPKTKAWHVPLTEERAVARFAAKWNGEQRTSLRPVVDASRVFPTCTRTKPWMHQLAAFRYLSGRDAALIDLQPGSGKSKVLVDYCINTPGVRRVLICAPLSFVGGWQAQFVQHAGRPCVVARCDTGSVASKMARAVRCFDEAKAMNRLAVVVINYDAVWREPFGEWALDAQFDVVAADEVQALRSPGSRRSRYAYRLGRQAQTRIGLSGTPFPESPLDAYGVCRFLSPSLLGTNYRAFLQRYAVLGGFGNHSVLGYINQEELKAKIATLRFHQEPQGYELPERLDIDIPLALPDAARTLYAQLQRDFYGRVARGEVTIANAAVAVVRLQQLTSGYIPLDDSENGAGILHRVHTAKRDALGDLLESFDRDEPVVVFCRFHHDLAAVYEVAHQVGRQSAEISGRPGRPALTLVGGTWADGPETVLAVQGQSGVEGVDLTRASKAVYYSYVWELGKYEQSGRRLLRAGQTRPCTYYHLLCDDTVDGRIRRLLAAKKNVLEALLEERDNAHESHSVVD